MSTIEDELRAVLDGFSEHGAPLVDRSTAVNAKIQHHQRVRAAALASALVIVLAVTGGVVSTGWWHPNRHSAPTAPAHEPDPKPGYLANYADGGKLAESDTAVMPGTTTITLTFTPTNWDFMIGDACVAPSRLWVSVFVNDNPLTAGGCAPGGGGGRSIDMGGAWDAHETFWETLGVHLGEPVTVTARIGTRDDNHPANVVATSDAGLASIGIYTPVPWNEYHFPAKPAHPNGFDQVGVELPASYAAVNTGNPTMMLKLPARIAVTAATIAPGSISVYINGVKIDQCDMWTYQDGCVGAIQDVGKGRLASFTVGETVAVTAQVTHLPPDTWEVSLGGSS